VILDLYFARRFLQSFLLISVVFLTLVLLTDLIDLVRKFDDTKVSFGQLMQLMMLRAPGSLNEILPLMMILATVVLFLGLARSSELVVTRAIGRSGIRAMAAPLVLAFAIGVLAVIMLNPIVTATSNLYVSLLDEYRSGRPSALSLSGEGLWLRQGGTQGQSVIHATGYGADGVTLFDVTILTYTPEDGPVQRISAESARLEDGNWQLSNAKIWPLGLDDTPEKQATEKQQMQLPTTLTEDRIQDSLGRQLLVSIYDMPRRIRELAEAGFSTKRYEVWYQVELARPLFLVAMVLVGAAFTMRHTRFGGTGTAILMSVLLGFGLYFIRNFAQILGENGQIPVYMAAWAPPIASILLTVGLLLHAEDG